MRATSLRCCFWERLSHKGGLSGGLKRIRACRRISWIVRVSREQGFLLPPDVRDWLPEGHLAWFVIDAVGELDLQAFYGAHRVDGLNRARRPGRSAGLRVRDSPS
jgi:hypothetical protein